MIQIVFLMFFWSCFKQDRANEYIDGLSGKHASGHCWKVGSDDPGKDGQAYVAFGRLHRDCIHSSLADVVSLVQQSCQLLL